MSLIAFIDFSLLLIPRVYILTFYILYISCFSIFLQKVVVSLQINSAKIRQFYLKKALLCGGIHSIRTC